MTSNEHAVVDIKVYILGMQRVIFFSLIYHIFTDQVVWIFFRKICFQLDDKDCPIIVGKRDSYIFCFAVKEKHTSLRSNDGNFNVINSLEDLEFLRC